ncbi:MAG: hypothetical protein Q9170_003894 [Blastenia crenularia]
MTGLPRVVLSANGSSVQSKAQRKQAPPRALVSASSLTGINAAPALHGNNGDNVDLELVPSKEGGFDAKGLIGKIDSMAHVDAGYDLFVDARGSDGEDGGRGEDGFPGSRGLDGKDATPNSEAVVRIHDDKLFLQAHRAHECSSQAVMEVGAGMADLVRTAEMGETVESARVSNLQGKIPANIALQFERALLGSGAKDDFLNAVSPRGYSAMNGDHAYDCRQMPAYTTRHKAGAPDGNKGSSGRSPAVPVSPGRDGSDGTVGILVRYDDGSVSAYDSKFEFELLGFDVVDENGDGIFEPGECVIIKNIRIKNSGGMPTPKKTLIPVTMQPSTWLTPISGKDSVYLPLEIAVGGTKRIADEIWAKIKSPTTPPNSTAFKAVSTIKIQAVVPDLDRRLPRFEPSQNISIQYPVKFITDGFKWMDTISQGSSTSLQWAVMNISSKDLGVNSQSRRTVVTRISCPTTAPVILGDTLSVGSQSDQCCRTQEIDFLRRDMSSPVSEGLLVAKNTPEYSTVEFLIEVLLTPASVGQFPKSQDPMTLQTHRLNMQVSKTWQYNASSEFLLLTSKSTTKDTIISWSQFIRKHLHKSVDVWNVSLYGGIEAEATYQSVLDSYVGKTVLALDDDLFSYFDRGQRSILDFIDPLEGSLLSRKGTRIISVHKKAKERHEREGKNMEHVAQAAALQASHTTNDKLHRYENTSELIDQLRRLRENPSTSTPNQQFFVPFKGSSPHSKGRDIAKKLTKEFPLDQFLVTDSSDGLGVRVVHCGAHGQSYSTAEVAQMSNGVGRAEEFSGLNPAEAYSCVAALPLKVRLDILLTSQQATGNVQYSEFIQNAALSSVKAELHDQVQAMAKRPRWRDGLFPDAEAVSTKSLFDSTNDNITAVLNHEIMLNAGACVDDPTSPAGQILRSIIQSARCQTTEQLLIKWFSPFKRTRSHVRRSLMDSVRDIIVYNGPNNEPDPNASQQDRFKNFKRTVSQKLVNKNYQVGINSGVQAITHDAIRDVKQSLTTIEEVMPQSVYKSPTELSTKKSSYERAELQRKRDRMQHRLWKKELGRDVVSSTASVKTDGMAEIEAGSSTYSTELASTSVYCRSVPSSRSETPTVLTLPEMDDVPASPIRKPPSPPPLKPKDKKGRSISPPSPLSPLLPASKKISAELPSTLAYNRRVVSTPNRPCPPTIPSPEPVKTPCSLSIKKRREPAQLGTNYTNSPQPPSPQSISILESPSPSTSRHHMPVPTSSPISPGFSPPELLDESDPWAAGEKAYEPPQNGLERQVMPASSSCPTHQGAADVSATDENASAPYVNERPAELDDALPHANVGVEPPVPCTLEGKDDDDDVVDELPVWSDYDEDDLKIDWTG